MAAERTETKIKLARLSGGGLMGVYTVTVVATDDWVDLSDVFEVCQFAKAYTTADGTNQEAYTDGTNKVYFDVAGAATFVVVGTSLKSTGGAT